MSISSVGFGAPLWNVAGIRTGAPRAAPEATAAAINGVEEGLALRAFVERLEALQAAVHDVRRMARQSALGRLSASARPATLRGAAVSDLKPGGGVIPGTKARLASTAEVNTTPTSFGPRGPAWAVGVSTAQVTIGGTYTGAVDETYTVSSQQNRTVGGGQPIALRVYNSAGAQVGTATFAGGSPAGTQVALIDGLTVSLGAGVVSSLDEFSFSVSASTGTDLDPDLPIGGVRNSDPELEDATPVTAGSFSVNGAVISVSLADTVRDVLDRITASAAGVVATYDDLTDTVLLERATVGALPITLAGDTSGLLAALKLSGATLTPGTDPTTSPSSGDLATEAMAGFTALAGVTAGTFQINGQLVSLDPATDSLSDVLDAMRAAVPGLRASLGADGVVSLSADVNLRLDGDTTGLLAVLGLDGATATAVAGAGRSMSGAAARRLADAISELQAPLRALYTVAEGAAARVLAPGQRAVAAAVGTGLGGALDQRQRFGFGFSFSAPAEGEGPLQIEARTLSAQLRRNPRELARLLIGGDRRGGLLGALDDGLRKTIREARAAENSRGALLDRYA
jgi:hypothetical protein